MTDILQRIKCRGIEYMPWLVLGAVCLFIQWLHLSETFLFNRTLIEQGELWRILTAHVTHLNWNHLWLNMAGVFMVAIFFGRYVSNRYWVISIIFISLFCSAGLMLDKQLENYVGFSGVLHGLFIIGARYELTRYKTSGIVLLVLIVGKLIWEQVVGSLPGSEEITGGRVAMNAHLYGALGGVVYLWLGSMGYKSKKAHDN